MELKLKNSITEGILPQPNYSNQMNESMLLGVNEESASSFKDFIKLTSDALKDINIDYSLTGALAANFYSDKPRNTADIDLLFIDSPGSKKKIVSHFKTFGFYIVENIPYMIVLGHKDHPKYQVDIMLAVGDPEESAVEMIKKVKIYGNDFNLMPGELLVWILLLSDQKKHLIDIENILKKPKSVNIDILKQYLKHDKDTDSIEKLDKFLKQSSMKEVNENYSNRMVEKKARSLLTKLESLGR